MDPATGYRYYRRDQVRDAMVMARLRTILRYPVTPAVGGDR
ncbi:hypothetical protein ABNF97_02500 [Plantactinospora sp. B6F1]